MLGMVWINEHPDLTQHLVLHVGLRNKIKRRKKWFRLVLPADAQECFLSVDLHSFKNQDAFPNYIFKNKTTKKKLLVFGLSSLVSQER